MNVLQVHADNFGKGGISQVIWRFMLELQKEEIVFSYLTSHDNIPVEYRKVVERNTGKIIRLDTASGNVLKRLVDKYKKLLKILECNHFHLVHINGNDMLGAFLYIKAAKKVGTKVIVHAHNTGFSSRNKVDLRFRQILNRILRLLYLKKTDYIIACSPEAADFMYGRKRSRKAIIIANGLHGEDYIFNMSARNNIRTNKYQVDDNIMVVGHIGRFAYAKNHEFLIKIFKELEERRQFKYELWLIGEGELQEQTRQLVKQLKIASMVRFLGSTDNVPAYLSAMDILLFPSRYEGSPLILGEAQANGLPVLCSDVITDAAICTERVKKLSLKSEPEVWAKEVENILKTNKFREPKNGIFDTELDMRKCVGKLLSIYNQAEQ